jgi:hypothetical protein
MEDTEKQAENSDKRIANLLPYQWKKGQSGNLHGRPKGKSMKEWAREYLERLTDEERDAFMEGIPKEVIWKMSEGNPKQDTEIRGTLTISEVLDKLENE